MEQKLQDMEVGEGGAGMVGLLQLWSQATSSQYIDH